MADRHAPAFGYTITGISLRVHDGPRFTQTKLEAADELHLLREFWQLVAPKELLLHPTVHFDVEFIRQRSRALGVIPTAVKAYAKADDDH